VEEVNAGYRCQMYEVLVYVTIIGECNGELRVRGTWKIIQPNL